MNVPIEMSFSLLNKQVEVMSVSGKEVNAKDFISQLEQRLEGKENGEQRNP